MKDKLENLLRNIIACTMALITVLFSVSLFNLGLNMINNSSNIDVLVGVIMTLLSIAVGAFGVVATLFYIKTMKD